MVVHYQYGFFLFGQGKGRAGGNISRFAGQVLFHRKLTEFCLKSKYTALAGHAFYGDVAPHQPGQLAGNDKAKARALTALGRGAVRLHEALENFIQILIFYSYASVGHLEFKCDHILNPVNQLNVKLHASLFGEFQGIAYQVDNNLAQAHGVAHNFGGHVSTDADAELKVFFLGAGLKHGHQGAKAFAQVYGLIIQADHVGFNLGEVKNIVNQGEQRFCRILGGVQIFLLFVVKFGDQGQIQHAQHSVHGRADFMAHAGQKIAFGFIRRLGRLFGQPEFPFHAPGVGHIANKLRHEFHFSFIGTYGKIGNQAKTSGACLINFHAFGFSGGENLVQAAG